MAMDAFDLAERFQTPVFLMTDLDLGMNNWMADPFPYPEKPIDRGKVLRTKEELEEHVAKFKEFARYRDVDGDGIPYRTLPGFIDTPGRRVLHARLRATPSARRTRSGPTTTRTTWTGSRASSRRREGLRARSRSSPNGSGARVGVIAYGSSDFAVEEARVLLARKGRRDRLPAPARASLHARDVRLRRGARPRLRRGPEPRRPDVRPPAPRGRRRRGETALHPPLRRLPPRRRDGRRGDRGRGEELMSSVAEPKAPPTNRVGLTVKEYGGPEVHALRGLRPRRHHAPDHAGVLRDGRSRPHKVAKMSGHRLLLQDDGVLRRPRARLQRRPRPHARRRDRRDAGQPVRCSRSASRATATPPRSAPASSCTCCAATSRWSTSSRTTASTA